MNSQIKLISSILWLVLAVSRLPPITGAILKDNGFSKSSVNSIDGVSTAESVEAFNKTQSSRDPASESVKEPVTEDEAEGKNDPGPLFEKTMTEGTVNSERITRKKARFPCRKQKLFIDFDHLGWNDFIFAPAGFERGTCVGVCHYSQKGNIVNQTNYAFTQSMFHEHLPFLVNPPCCVPIKLQPLSVLLTDDRGMFVIKSFPDMIVEECGCR